MRCEEKIFLTVRTSDEDEDEDDGNFLFIFFLMTISSLESSEEKIIFLFIPDGPGTGELDCNI